jgi:hypothetical protein
MIQLKFLSDGVVGVGLLWLRLFERVIQFVNVVKNALVKRFITLYRCIWVALSMILATLSRYVKRAITKSVTALFRK